MTDVRSIELVPGVPGPTNHGTPSNCGWAPVDGHHSCHVLLRRSFRPLEEPIVRWTAARKKLRVTGGNDAMLAFVGGGTTIASGTRNHFMAKTGSDYRLAHTSSGTVTHAEARCRRPHQLVCGVGTPKRESFHLVRTWWRSDVRTRGPPCRLLAYTAL